MIYMQTVMVPLHDQQGAREQCIAVGPPKIFSAFWGIHLGFDAVVLAFVPYLSSTKALLLLANTLILPTYLDLLYGRRLAFGG